MWHARIKQAVIIGILCVAFGGCQQKAADKGSAKGGMASGDMAGGQSLPTAHMGKAFALKEVTDIGKLLSDPKAFKGKTVHVKGLVVAHCHHKRAWFALATTKDSNQKLQVWTKHAFLVPKDVKHGVTRAEAEGVIEVKTVPENRAKHLATEHGLFGGDPAKISGPQYLPSLKVTGAKFDI